MTDTLQGSADQLRIQSLEADIAILQSQLATIAQMLLDEAIGRDFCSEYDEFVDQVNEKLGVPVLLHMNRLWEVSFTGTLNVVALNAQGALDVANQEMETMSGRSEYSVSWDVHDATLSG